MKWILWVALVLSNLTWAYKYHQLWLDDAQANAMLDWANEYMRDMGTHQETLLKLVK